MKSIFKILGFVALGVLSSMSLSAQDEDDRVYNRSFGIDASFINNFLPVDGVVGLNNDYMFHFMKYKENSKFKRKAFDIDILGSFSRDDDEPNVDNTRLFIEYKFTRGKTKTIFKNASIFYGGEVLLDYFFNQRVTEDDGSVNAAFKTTSRGQTAGLSFGPMIGFEYRFSDRFSVFTEAGYYIGVDYTLSTFKRDTSTVDVSRSKVISFSDAYRLPTSIVLFYSF